MALRPASPVGRFSFPILYYTYFVLVAISHMNIKTAIAVVIALLVVGIFSYFAFLSAQPTDLDVVPTEQVEEQNQDMQSSGKIDINAVCEGALAYMSFPDSASAELFVSECKEGKHPEVIEKFKADMNVGAGAAI